MTDDDIDFDLDDDKDEDKQVEHDNYKSYQAIIKQCKAIFVRDNQNKNMVKNEDKTNLICPQVLSLKVYYLHYTKEVLE